MSGVTTQIIFRIQRSITAIAVRRQGRGHRVRGNKQVTPTVCAVLPAMSCNDLVIKALEGERPTL